MTHRKQITTQASIYIPDHRKGDRILERFITLAIERERSVNHLLIQALDQYLDGQAVA